MTNEMVESVAWAIHKAFWRRQFGEQIGSANHAATVTWEDAKESRLEEARAAIEAMREPTEPMIDRAWRLIGSNLRYEEVYRHMIAAALKGEGE